MDVNQLVEFASSGILAVADNRANGTCRMRNPKSTAIQNGPLPTKRRYDPFVLNAGGSRELAAEAIPTKRTKQETLLTNNRVRSTKVSMKASLRTKRKTRTKLDSLKNKKRVKSTKGSTVKAAPARKSTKPEGLLKKRGAIKVSVKVGPARGTKRKADTKLETLSKKQKVSVKVVPAKESKQKSTPQTLVRGKSKPKVKPETLMRRRKGKSKLETLTRRQVGKDKLKRRQRGKTNEGTVRTRSKRKVNTKPETLTRRQWVKATQMSMIRQAEKRLLATTGQASFEQKYQQLEKIGEGGFGSVYAGYRKCDSFAVAIKHIPKDEVKIVPLNINGRKQDVPLEALLMLQASSIKDADGRSAVVSLLDKYDLEQELVLVMEKPVRSVDMFTYITRCRLGHLKEHEAKNIMKQLVDAAIKMHAVNVFHRDLKPGNILLEATYGVPRVRIIDFGCSCFVTEEPYHDYTGTLSYAPPEFVLRGAYRAGPTTVWHLGAMLFELLAGTKQFDTLLFISQMLGLNRVLSQDCRDFLQMCLNSNPDQRATLVQIHQHPWLL
ncbi:aurora kinase B-like [Dunckerocampus dactyliophorus]|uniref:aurora kinase B-like n=1 Tax=Dunckerocampus dactyliophorus TaxID=161453 RepID=UPI002406356B|nr:aurora kinase B-like [Dunckerocampus dactyliophorus]